MHWLTYISALLLPLVTAEENLPVPEPGSVGGPQAVADAGDALEAERLFGRVWKPKQLQPFQIVVSATVDANETQGPIDPEKFPIFDVDLFDNTKETISILKKSGRKVICYFSAGTSEDWREDFKQLKPKDIGASLPMWPGEKWLDIRSRDVFNLMKKRIRYASEKGCDALDPDNVDGFENERGGGFKPELTKRDTISYVRRLSRYAHLYGMSIGLKNALAVLPQLTRNVEFAVNEECATEEEACEEYRQFLNPRRGQGKPVFHIEYVTRTPLYSKIGRRDGSGPQDQGKPTGWKISEAGIPGLFAGNKTQAQIRNKLCAKQNRNIGSKMTTVIKVMALDGWIMDCEGRTWFTRGKTIDKGHGGKIHNRFVDDPQWSSILNSEHADDKIDNAWEAAFNADLDKELAASGFDNTSKKRGSSKERRGSKMAKENEPILSV